MKSTNMFSTILCFLVCLLISNSLVFSQIKDEGLKIRESGYFEMPGLNVLVYNNTFPEGHQGGVEIIQHDNRVATNGELRLSPTPGQWQPIPMLGEGYEARGVSPQDIGIKSRIVDIENNSISMPCSYPDTNRSRKGFNPIIYPDLNIKYNVTVKAEGTSFKIIVDLEEPLPEEWVGRVGYNIELFPGNLYGKTFMMDGKAGIFQRQAGGPTYRNSNGEFEAEAFAKGKKLIVAPESDLLRMEILSDTDLLLIDGSLKHNNGWFTVRTLIPANKTKNAIVWKVSPNVIPNWKRDPIVHVSQVGYHPNQAKTAFIELDKNENEIKSVSLFRLNEDGSENKIKEVVPKKLRKYLRYNYLILNFDEVTEEGIYQIRYDKVSSNQFRISRDIFKYNVWQPTLEYFIPVQMCHMRVNQKYRVWHGACHLDDALMAPLNIKHFDGYNNQDETSTLSTFKPLEHVPGLNIGGWHDAGDYDLRIESQAQTVIALAAAYEEFGVENDETLIDQKKNLVELFTPDGQPDILQQVEHGVLSILGSYKSMGRLYRGIIAPSLRQYVHLGDASTHTDNVVCDDFEGLKNAAAFDELWYKKVANKYSNIFDPELNHAETELVVPGLDDRLVFNSSNPHYQFIGASALAAASRVLGNYNSALAKECINTAEKIWKDNKNLEGRRANLSRATLLTELILTTDKIEYKNALCNMTDEIIKSFNRIGASVSRVINKVECKDFRDKLTMEAKRQKKILDERMSKTPFNSPLSNTEYFAYNQYFLHKAWPDIYSLDYMYSIINFLLGARPGNATNSLVSGVGANSPTIAYGANRADWSYIPGGTFWNAVNLVEPDFPEDKVWPFIWQEREYIITAPAYYMFSVIAADRLLNKNVD